MAGYNGAYGAFNSAINDVNEYLRRVQANAAKTPGDTAVQDKRKHEEADAQKKLNVLRLGQAMQPAIMGGIAGQISPQTMLGMLTGGLLMQPLEKLFSGGFARRRSNAGAILFAGAIFFAWRRSE